MTIFTNQTLQYRVTNKVILITALKRITIEKNYKKAILIQLYLKSQFKYINNEDNHLRNPISMTL